MKILKIIGIVAGIHALALLIIFANPGCSSTSKPQTVVVDPVKETPPPVISVASYATVSAPITASPVSTDTATAPAFNPDAPATGGAIRYSPTRPGSTAASALEAQPVADVTPATTYTVGKGDSLWTIAKKNHLPVADLASANGLRASASIKPGQKLVIPSKTGSTAAASAQATEMPPAETTPAAAALQQAATSTPGDGSTTYTVKNGESLGSIARKLHVSVGRIAAANSIADPRTIRPGQVLTIPAKTDSTKGKTASSRAQSTTAPSAPAAQLDLDAGLKGPAAGEVPVIKVDDNTPSIVPKN